MVWLSPRTAASSPSAEQPLSLSENSSAYFVKEVRPILQKHCFECHGTEKVKSSLRLDTSEGILLGGNSGEPLIQPNAPSKSYLIQKITHEDSEERMPPNGPGVSDTEQKILLQWIAQGAQLPE